MQRIAGHHLLVPVCNHVFAVQRQELLPAILNAVEPDRLRGLEGAGSAAYFGVLDGMILQGKDTFYFHGRSRRPPLDPFSFFFSCQCFKKLRLASSASSTAPPSCC